MDANLISNSLLRRSRSYVLPILAALVLSLSATGSSMAQPPGKPLQRELSVELEEMLGWLPEDSESLMVATGPYYPDPPNPNVIYSERGADEGRIEISEDQATSGEVSAAPISEADRVFMRFAVEASGLTLFKIFGREFVNQIARQPLRHTLLATRRFGPVKSIPGGAPFEGCAILWFDRAIPQIEVHPGSRVRTERIEGHVVASYDTHEEWGENKKLILRIAHPKPNVLLVATDQRFLTTVLSRMRNHGSSRAFPKELAAWQDTMTTSPVWGIRYEVETSNPASIPASRQISKELTYFLESKSSRQIVMLLRSAKHDPAVAINQFYKSVGVEPQSNKTPPARLTGKDLAEARLSADHESVFVLSLMMGYIVYP